VVTIIAHNSLVFIFDITSALAVQCTSPRSSPNPFLTISTTKKAPTWPIDGGSKAWLSTFGAWWAIFITFGWVNSPGVFQSYYERTLLRDYSPSAISWIASVQQCLIYSTGIVLGKLFDGYGPRWLVIIGGLTQVFGLMMISISIEYYQRENWEPKLKGLQNFDVAYVEESALTREDTILSCFRTVTSTVSDFEFRKGDKVFALSPDVEDWFDTITALSSEKASLEWAMYKEYLDKGHLMFTINDAKTRPLLEEVYNTRDARRVRCAPIDVEYFRSVVKQEKMFYESKRG
jgi:hypothetical protein